jgi:hypothetical protein
MKMLAKKNSAVNVPKTSTADRFAVRIVASRSIRSGTIGALTLVSITRNAVSRATTPIRPPMVRRLAPAHVGSLAEREDQQKQPGGEGHGAGRVEPVALLRGPALGHDPHGERRARQADRYVDPEVPLPAGPAGEDAADDDTDDGGYPGQRAPDSQRLVTPGALRKGVGQDRQRSRRDERGPEALQATGADQQDAVLREPGAERGQGEHDEPQLQHPPAAERVGQPRPPSRRNPPSTVA